MKLRHVTVMIHRVAVMLLATAFLAGAVEIRLPCKPGSFKFAVFGDTGTGGREQYEIAQQAASCQRIFPFELAIMLGDNMYGGEAPRDFQKKFEAPYKTLMERGVKFYAALGNHDDAEQRMYKLFNMNGERYYTFRPKADIRFFALDSNYMDQDQFKWVEKALTESHSKWKIVFFHHPLYSSGRRHGPNLELRKVLEPLFVPYGVSFVFAGHEHFYERMKPQSGIYHVIMGSSGKLRRGGINKSNLTARGFDEDRAFVLCEIDGDTLYLQAISRTGETIDYAALPCRKTPHAAAAAAAAQLDVTRARAAGSSR
ncbi:MAG: metallophosphoesterase [Acidobacteria bacterium]|nr:metallophosphoesterase [Acidobacteriota bacterium]